jgi:hypothetical protein
MRPDDLKRLLHTQPFQPFRMFVLEQKSYEVRHPEAALVGQSTVMVIEQVIGPNQVALDQEVIIALLHITRLERLGPSSLGNGAAP